MPVDFATLRCIVRGSERRRQRVRKEEMGGGGEKENGAAEDEKWEGRRGANAEV